MSVFDKGDLVRFSASFKVSGSLTDPAAVYFSSKAPGGTTTCLAYGTDAALEKASLGVYETNVNINEAGTWYYRFWSTGSGQGAEQAYIRAVASYI